MRAGKPACGGEQFGVDAAVFCEFLDAFLGIDVDWHDDRLAQHDRAIGRRLDGQRYLAFQPQAFQHRPGDRDLALFPQFCEFHGGSLGLK